MANVGGSKQLLFKSEGDVTHPSYIVATPMIAPEEYPRYYFNRKGWPSIVLQYIVDGKGLF